jgi:hypothetical protein
MKMLAAGLILATQAVAQSFSGISIKGETMMLAAPSSGGAFTVSAFSTNTQAALTYTAPSSTACTVAVSESPTLSPVVHDVDPGLFPGADSDSRSDSISNGAHRIFVLGKRQNDTAADGKIYSRALQAYTTHYYRVDCSGTAVSGSFTTANIPVGNTYSDTPPTNAPTFSKTDRSQKIIDARTGALIRRVTLPGDMISAYSPINGAFLGYSGFTRMCGHALAGPGPGYLCAFPNGDGAFGLLYYIIPATGDVRFLGSFGGEFGGAASQPKIDPIDNKIYVAGDTVVRFTYAGDYSEAAPGTYASFTSEVFMPTSAAALITAFDPTIDTFTGPERGTANAVDNGANSDVTWVSGDVFTPAMVGNKLLIGSDQADTVIAFTDSHHIKLSSNHGSRNASAWSRPQPTLIVDGAYGLITLGKGIQDSYGGMAVLDMGNRLPIGSCGSDPMACPHIVAAANTSKQPATRWCGLHTIMPMTGDTLQPLIFQSFHEIVGPFIYGTQYPTGVKEGSYYYDTGQPGMGPYYTRLQGAVNVGQTSIVVDGEPSSPNAPDSHLQDMSVGDYFMLRDTNGTGDKYRITAKADAQHWTITPAVTRALPDRTRVVATCQGNWLSYWKFLEDPNGSDTTNTKVVFNNTWPLGGHDDWGPNLRLTEGYLGVKGPIQDNLATAPNFSATSSPPFAGVTGQAYGNAVAMHPSYHQVNVPATDQSWFLDAIPMAGDPGLYNPPLTLVSGQLWKFQSTTNGYWNRKVLPTFGITAKSGMTDVSGPGASLGDTAADANKYCVVVAPGECHAGSVAGEVYANVTASTGACGGDYSKNDICIIPFPTFVQAVAQIGLTNPDSPAGTYSRVLTNGFFRPRNPSGFDVGKSLPNASYAMFGFWDTTGLWDTGHTPPWDSQITKYIFMVKLPPYAKDGVDRSTFIRVPIAITPPAGLGITTAAVEFGYGEFGTPAQHYCTQRKEACVAVSSTVTDSNPFQFVGSETYARMPCSSSCTITLPVLPAHTAYYTVKFYNAGGALVQSGETGVVVETVKLGIP